MITAFFWLSLAIFIWQLIVYVSMDSDQEWYRKHPRGEKLGEAIDDDQVPPPPPISGAEYRINLVDKK